MNWLADNWKTLFDGVAGVAAVAIAAFLLKRWLGPRKESIAQQTKSTVQAENSSLVDSSIVSGSQIVQTVNSPTIHADIVHFTSAVNAAPPSDSTRKPKPVVVVAAVVTLTVIIAALFPSFRAKTPTAAKAGPDLDTHGHPQPIDASRDERAVRELQDQIKDLVEHKDRVRYSDFDRQQLKDAAYLGDRMSGFRDVDLRPRYRYVKYEYAAFAFEMAAVFAMPDDHQKAAEYATNAINNADAALSLLKQAEGAYQSDEESRVLLDWVNKEDFGKDRVLYIMADSACLRGKVRNDPALKSQALGTWNQIGSIYRGRSPANGTPELSGCVPITKSD